MPSYTAYSCDEEYDDACEAEAQAEAEGYAAQCEAEDAVKRCEQLRKENHK